MTRITAKYLQDWVNKKFEHLEITEYECYLVERTYFTTDQYESGATALYIKIRSKGSDNPYLTGTMFCFYSMRTLTEYINNGYELFIKFKRNASLNEAELDIRKSLTPITKLTRYEKL